MKKTVSTLRRLGLDVSDVLEIAKIYLRYWRARTVQGRQFLWTCAGCGRPTKARPVAEDADGNACVGEPSRAKTIRLPVCGPCCLVRHFNFEMAYKDATEELRDDAIETWKSSCDRMEGK